MLIYRHREEPAQNMTIVNQPLLFEMIRSFTTLARTLNLSHAVAEMGITRQTVRRHIEALEAAMGFELFEVIDRRYHLTPEGVAVLPSAESIQAQGRLWFQGRISDIGGMMRVSHADEKGWEFYQQQQPVGQIWDSKSALLRTAVVAWAQSGGELENPQMEVVRPYVLVYRDTPSGWICVEVGEQSFYSNWWGWANARSSIGRLIGQFPGGPEFARIMDTPYREVNESRGLRLDQIVTYMPREPDGPLMTVCFQRLLMGMQLPDGSFALVTVVDRPEEINIDGLDQSRPAEMPEDVKEEFSVE